MRRAIIFALPLVCALTTSALAQPAFTATVGRGLDALQPTGAASDAQHNTAAGGAAEYVFADQRARAFYDVAVTDYTTPGDWRSVAQNFGGRYRFDLGTPNRSLFLGSTIQLRRNGDAWQAANYNAVGGFANLEWRPRETATFRTGYRLDVRRFPTYAAMDQQEHTGFGSLLWNFQSRTTVIAEATVGTKHYEGAPSTTEFLAQHATAPVVEGTWLPGSGQGQAGKGTTGQGNQGGAMSWLVFAPVTVPGTPSSSAQQVAMFVRVAQSLASRTSVLGEVSWRNAFGEVPPAVITTPARFFDDGVYDDPYASDSRLGRLSMKSIVWGDVELNASGSWQLKPYGATPALDGDGAPVQGVLREDRVTRASAFATWPILPSRTGQVELDLITGYDYTRHRSTTAVYNYTSHAVSVGFGVGY